MKHCTRTFFRFLLPLFLTFSFSKVFAEKPIAERTDAGHAFDRLAQLVGTWKVKGSESSFRIRFELTAGNSVLVENWLSKGKSGSLTVYHRDGNELLATHYCPQGNQPRLKLVRSPDDNQLQFRFFDITGLHSDEHSHQNYLSFTFRDDNTLVRAEKYKQGKKENADEMVLVRTEPLEPEPRDPEPQDPE